MRRSRFSLLMVVFVAGSALLTFAQTASIQGTVFDRAGAVVTGAEIVVTNIGTGQVRTATSGGSHDRYSPGLHHLAWRVESREAVDAAHALLVEHRIPVLDPPAHYPEYSGDYYAVFFADPDGIKLEIVHAPGWI